MHTRAKSLQSCPALCDPMDCRSPGSSVHRDSPDKNTGVGCHALLQGIFLTQGSKPGLLVPLNWQVGSSAPPGSKQRGGRTLYQDPEPSGWEDQSVDKSQACIL